MNMSQMLRIGIVLQLLYLTVTLTKELYSDKDNVKIFMAADFQQRVIAKGDVWLIKFFSNECTHCVSMAPIFKDVAKALKGIVNVGVVDIKVNPKLSTEYAPDGVPNVLLFNLHEGKPKQYSGSRKSLDIVRFVLDSFENVAKQRLGIKDDKKEQKKTSDDTGDGTVINLTDSNFDAELQKHEDKFWLVEFFAPWCGHCKSLAPEWTKAAKLLKGKAILAAVDATVHNKVSSRFGIQGFPTIKAFLPNKHDNPLEYDGPRDSMGIANWVTRHLDTDLPPPEIVELVSQKTFDQATSKTICLITFLPHLLDCQSKCRNSYMHMLKELAADFAKHQWGWLWAEGMVYADLEELVGIGDFGYPAMVALNSKKQIYAIFKGAFTKQGITSFLKEISTGRVSTVPLRKEFPKIKSTSPWDGKDYEDTDDNGDTDNYDTSSKVEL